jgi:hypothetical protein
MNWDAVGAFGEVIGASAVVISLLYLAVQIRSQVRQNALSAMHDVSVGFRDIIKDFQHPQAAELQTRANREGVESLSDAELFQIMVGAQRFFRLWEEAFYLHQDGRLDERIWDGLHRQFSAFISTQGYSYAWKMRREFYGADFRDVVDNAPGLEYVLR